MNSLILFKSASSPTQFGSNLHPSPAISRVTTVTEYVKQRKNFQNDSQSGDAPPDFQALWPRPER